MTDSSPHPLAGELRGFISHVDPVRREIAVRVADSVITFHVHCNSSITLRGERVKLRLIQPGDDVRVRFGTDGQALVADLVEVQTHRPALAG